MACSSPFSQLAVWRLKWDAGDLGLSLLFTLRLSPSSCGKHLESTVGSLESGWIFFFFKLLSIPPAGRSPYIMEIQVVTENIGSPIYSISP